MRRTKNDDSSQQNVSSEIRINFKIWKYLSEDIKIRIDHAESRIKNLCSGYTQTIPSVFMIVLLIIFQRFSK